MADKRKTRKRKEEVDEKPSKEEYSIAKYMRSHLPVKKTTLLSHKVEYFIASKAVDCLLESPWATNKKGQETLFTNRESVIEYLNTMLIHKFFHRARKILVSQKDVKSKKKSKDQDDQSHADEGTKEKKSKDKKEKDKKDKESSKGTGDKQGTKSVEGSDAKKQDGETTTKEKKKEKRKIKLDMHLEQFFVDGNEAYVWIYDPIPTTAWLIGGLLVVGGILLCLFPLWPSSVRKGVYYISVAAAGFLCVIVALINIRIIIFCIVWLLTFGKHHLWILPNLTEDVGFFESFWPLYKYEYKGNKDEKESSEKSKRRQKEKDSDKEKNSDEEKRKGGSETDREPTDSEHDSEDDQQQHQQQQQNSNGDNGFEMVDEEELEQEQSCKSRKSNSKREKRS